MIPTLLGIMLVSFVVVQFAPGGPVERVIAQLSGADTGAGSRIPGSGAGRRFRRARRAGRLGGRRHDLEVPRRPGPRPGVHQEAGKAVRLRQAGHERFFLMLKNFMRVRFRQELFPRHQRDAAHQGEAAGVDVARHLDDAADLPDLDPARHPQGGVGRLALRHLDLGHHHHRLRHPGLPDRDLPDHPVRRRLVLGRVSAARADLGQLGGAVLVAEDPRLLLASDAADHRHDAQRLRHHDAADQELVPRRDQEAVRADRAGQGLHAAPDALRPHLPQRHADRDRGLSRAPSCTRSSPARC